jgi:mannose-6-phosphate isomerase class I
MLEIQDTCDVTYRLHDWGRTDAQGRGRPLHLDAGLEALDLSDGGKGGYRSSELLQPGLLAKLGDFELWLHEDVAPGAVSVAAREVPVVVVVVAGSGRLSGRGSGRFRRGDVILFPAGEGSMMLTPVPGERLRVIEARPGTD